MTIADTVSAVKPATIDLEIELRTFHLQDRLRLDLALKQNATSHRDAG